MIFLLLLQKSLQEFELKVNNIEIFVLFSIFEKEIKTTLEK